MKRKLLGSRRYLALFLPLLSTDRIAKLAAQAGHAPDNRPLVTVAKRASALRIMATDAAAQKLGLHAGLAFADARLRVPDMHVVEHDEAADRDLLERVADWCDRYSPIIACQPPDMLMLDITGVAHLFGGEAGLATHMQANLARQGLAARIAVAGTARSARAQCRFGDGGIVLPGMALDTARALPVEALECDTDTRLALRRAGLLSLGDFISRPRQPLAARFGTELTDRLALILEETDRPLVPRRPLPTFWAEQRFADPIGLMDDIAFALESLADDLCGQLARQGQGGRNFELSFYRADGKIERIELLSGQPLDQPKTLRRLFEMRLDALADPLDPGFGFDMMRLSVLAGDPLAPLQSGLDGKAEARQAVSELVDRLSARFGAGSVQRLIPCDTHLPERASRSVSAVSDMPETLRLPERASRSVSGISDTAGTGRWRETGLMPSRPLFLFFPAPQVDVVAEIPDGPPRRFLWRGVSYDVAKAEGPERISPEWWRRTTDTRTRDYFRVEDTRGQRFWLFRYGLYGRGDEPVRWFVQGIFP